MGDKLSKKERSVLMSRIRSKNTKSEVIIRKGLYRNGFRYRLHQDNLLGKPDLVLRKYASVIFINGCFWHGHNCSLFYLPRSNITLWKEKLNANRVRGLHNINRLLDSDWRVLIIWECSIRGKFRLGIDETLSRVINFLESHLKYLVVKEDKSLGNPKNI